MYRFCVDVDHNQILILMVLIGMYVFWTWAPFFKTCTCFLDLEKCGGRACVFSGPYGDLFFGPACICAGPIFFYTAKLIVSDLGFCFLDPCACFVDLDSIVIGAHTGLDVFGLWRILFLNLYMFFGPRTSGGNSDTETRCMQEVVDAGEVRILKQQKGKKW